MALMMNRVLGLLGWGGRGGRGVYGFIQSQHIDRCFGSGWSVKFKILSYFASLYFPKGGVFLEELTVFALLKKFLEFYSKLL
jgi:hypothetical protein